MRGFSEEGRKMANTRSTSVSAMNAFLTLAGTKARYILAALTTLLFSLTCMAQDNPQSQPAPPASQTMQASATPPAVQIVPAGTRIALVLTHPIQSRYIHRGDDIYAQIISPVNSGTEMQIPPGTFVTGKVDKLEVKSGGRAELHLQSMSITFPDGYVAPVSGPVTLESNEGYALKDPGNRRMAGALAVVGGGAGLGALIGHSVGTSQSTLTTTLPPGCNPALPNCLSSSIPTAGSKGIDTGIGATVGGAIGGITAFVLLASSRHFFLDVGTPVDMVLTQPLSLQQNQISGAGRQSGQYPVSIQPVAPRPLPPPDTDHGTCYIPGTPGTPPTIIPGTPGPDGIPGPPTIIPGTLPTPGTPYPCP
jgi:hypothetical protein